jgi:hypothetical protein
MNDEGNKTEQRTRPSANAIMDYTAPRAQQAPLGHDNAAFDRSTSQSDVSEIGIDCQYTRNGHQSPTSPAALSVVRNFVVIFTFSQILHFLTLFTKKNSTSMFNFHL